DIDAGDEMVDRIKHHMRRTYGPRVLGKHGGFAGCFRLDYNERLFKRNYREPVLVSCTDGVGTKVKLATQMQVYDTVGRDLVAMSVNDLVVQGAEPLFFLDYIATSKLDPAVGEQLVKGVADGCETAQCALLGGETAEMPDVYNEGEFDLAGFAVGVCEISRLIDGSRCEPGDVMLGLASSGVHSNGYSLVRNVIDHAGLDLHQVYDDLETDRTLGQVLLEPTRIYAANVVAALRHYTVKQVVAAMCHVTGGGLPGNLPRTLTPDVDARVDLTAWRVPPVFRFLQKHGHVEDAEMRRVFNMGVGYVMIVRPYFAEAIADRLTRMGETVWRIGELVPGTGRVQFE
ncbi:MAG: phosphoribosylformylglycinamidine cyclo-ligase, partial [Phycisphaeraceae bacterium]